MKKVIVLSGPPGVGKSTLVKLAQSKKIEAYDIEEMHNETKKKLSHLSSSELEVQLRNEMKIKIDELLSKIGEGISIIGVGGYGGFFLDNQVQRVLLLPEKEIARTRFEMRDKLDLVKAAEKQNFEQVYDYFAKVIKDHPERFALVITDSLSEDETLELILKT